MDRQVASYRAVPEEVSTSTQQLALLKMAKSASKLVTQELFGGAILMGFPEEVDADASAFREVPDNQEVYVESGEKSSSAPGKENEKDDAVAKASKSIIVEILDDMHQDKELTPAMEFYFKNLAEENEAEG